LVRSACDFASAGHEWHIIIPCHDALLIRSIQMWNHLPIYI